MTTKKDSKTKPEDWEKRAKDAEKRVEDLVASANVNAAERRKELAELAATKETLSQVTLDRDRFAQNFIEIEPRLKALESEIEERKREQTELRRGLDAERARQAGAPVDREIEVLKEALRTEVDKTVLHKKYISKWVREGFNYSEAGELLK